MPGRCAAGNALRSAYRLAEVSRADPRFDVEQCPAAETGIEAYIDLLLERRETSEDLEHAQSAIRATAQQPAQPESIIPIGITGWVPLYEIARRGKIVMLAMREGDARLADRMSAGARHLRHPARPLLKWL